VKWRRAKTTDYVGELADGRSIAVVNWPMAGGGWVATHEDITESKRREAIISPAVSKIAPCQCGSRCRDMRFLAVNDAAVAHYGYSRDQYRVMTVYDIRPVEDHERFRQFMQTDRGVHEGEQIWASSEG